jgi:cholest-4-en-3-one 26-monooxygenase
VSDPTPTPPVDLADLNDLDVFVEGVPHDTLTYWREHDPVHWTEEPDGRGYWALFDYESVTIANRDAGTFSSEEGGTLIRDLAPDQLEMNRMIMLNMDPPKHTRYRLLVSKGFSPKHIRELERAIDDQARSIVDNVIERGECDFVTDLAAELPLQVIADIMGVPREDRGKLFDWSNRMIGSEDPEYTDPGVDGFEAAGTAQMELFAYASALAQDRLANPRDDIISAIVHAEIEGDSLSEMEVNLFFLLLAVAGNETTRNLTAHGMQALFDHPEQRAWLQEDLDARLPSAIEEMLRWGVPVMNFRREVMHDVVLGGKEIPAGDKVVLWYISANRDEKVFPNPFTFDLARSPNDHVTFGGRGPHFCLGANLARAELRAIFREMLSRMPDMQPTAPPSRLRSNFINGIKHMPIEFTPGARSSS